MPKRMHGDEDIRANELVRVLKQEKIPKQGELKNIAPTPQNYKKFKGEGERKKMPKHTVWGVAALVVLFLFGFLISSLRVHSHTQDSLTAQIVALQNGIADLKNFNPQSAQAEFSLLSETSTPNFGDAMGLFGFLFKGGNMAMTSFSDLAVQFTTLTEGFISLQSGFLHMIVASASLNPQDAGASGSALITTLTSVQNSLSAVDTDTNQLSAILVSASGTAAVSGADFYLPLKAKIEAAQHFLAIFIPWFSDTAPHHILVLLQNPLEMRASGGFLGSYADVTISAGAITAVSLHDITDVDAAFLQKIIPPQPLQLETKSFRPADANWFFDFPTSASKTIQFFESSGLYNGVAVSGTTQAASTTVFDAAVAISPKVISDLLSITGPITVSVTSTKGAVASTTFTSDTVLSEMQNMVEQGQAGKSSTASIHSAYPKQILGELSQAIFMHLASTTDDENDQLFSMILDWIAKKDVMVYFTNPAFESFFASYGATGDVYQLPQDFNGDYLAVVDSSINSDKSDFSITQDVTLDSQINADGTISDDLSINRLHNGASASSWWYKTANVDYLQVFVPDGTSLTNEIGGITKTIVPPLNYQKNGYSTDPTVFAIESSTLPNFGYPAVTSHEESGKEVFATWSRVVAGASTTLEFNYTHRAFALPAAGVQYQFIFEKQAGSNRSYDFTIDAPLGYAFVQNHLASYEYTSDDPPGRLVIDLTLEKI